jgi:predicted MPP superfamily phosphohydrolase
MNLWPQLAVTGLFGFVVLLTAVYCVRILLLTTWKKLTGNDRLTRPWLDRLPARVTILALGAVGTLCFLYALCIEPYQLGVTHEIAESPAVVSTGGIRIVHLSDLHIDADGQPVAGAGMALWSAPGIPGSSEVGLADLVNAQKPDLVVMTGDYLNSGSAEGEETLRRLLRSIRPPFGVFAVMGNWDYRVWSRAPAILRQEGVHVLSADSAEITVRGTRVMLSGEAGFSEIAEAGRPGAPALRVFLSHTPDSIEDIAGRVDLYFCGHTHGGQVRLPGFGAIVTLSRFWKRYEMGRYEVRGTTLFVNRGIGCEGGPVPRVRFLSPPDVLVVDVINSAP